MERFVGFQPVFDQHSRVLILGSFPSVKSREQMFYYGNAQNRFWRVLAEAFGETLPQTTEEKRNLCLKHGVALWDIVTECEIVGSMDANIRNCKTADLSKVLDACAIEKILCNGAAAYKLTRAAYDGSIPVVQLPSTSPANVRFDKTPWLTNLKN